MYALQLPRIYCIAEWIAAYSQLVRGKEGDLNNYTASMSPYSLQNTP